MTIRDELEQAGLCFAPLDVAHRFSFEGDEQFGVSWSGQFGFHGLTWTDISAWLAAHPNSGIVNQLDSQSLELLEVQRRARKQ